MIKGATDVQSNVTRRTGAAPLALSSAQWQPYRSTIQEEQE
jgi:hypothetical protein